MKRPPWLIACAVPLAAFLSLPSPAQQAEALTNITWKKTVLDKVFRSEGVAVADVNKDGKMDVLIGEVWYEAPDWKMHEIRKPGDYGDGQRQLQQQLRLLGRGPQRRRLARPDRRRLPRRAVPLVREPQGQGRPLEAARDLAQRLQRDAAVRRPVRHRQARPRHGLAAQGQGQRWARWPTSRPGKDPTQALGDAPDQRAEQPRARTIPGTQRFSHGLGVGDLNGDGRTRRDLHRRLVGAAGQGRRQDALEVPPRPRSATPAPTCSPTTSTATARPTSSARSAHQFGIWWYQQRPAARASRRRSSSRTCSPTSSRETHALSLRRHQRRRPEGPRHRQALLVARPERAGGRQARDALLVRGEQEARTA